MRTNSKRVGERILPASSFVPDFLRLARGRAPRTTLGPTAASFRPKFEKRGNDAIGWRSPSARTGHPQRRRRRTTMRMAALAAGPGVPPLRAEPAAILALGLASRRSERGLALQSSVPAAPAPVAPGAQPQMSSHNSRLAADSYKNCVWTISGETPEFRAPVSCGVPLRSLKATDQEISRAAHPTTSQMLSNRNPYRGKVDEQTRGSRPCLGNPHRPWHVSPYIVAQGLWSGPCWVAAPPQVGGISNVGPGNPDSPLPAPSLGFPARQESGKRGPEARCISKPEVRTAGLVGSPPPPSPGTHRLGCSPLPCG